MGFIGETIDSIKSIKIRQLLTQAITLGSFLYDYFNLICVLDMRNRYREFTNVTS